MREPRPPATALRQRLAAQGRPAPCGCSGTPRRPSLRRRTQPWVVHKGWGKRRAPAGELVPHVWVAHSACEGSRGKKRRGEGFSGARNGRRGVILERLRLAKPYREDSEYLLAADRLASAVSRASDAAYQAMWAAGLYAVQGRGGLVPAAGAVPGLPPCRVAAYPRMPASAAAGTDHGKSSAKPWHPCTPAMAAGLTERVWT